MRQIGLEQHRIDIGVFNVEQEHRRPMAEHRTPNYRLDDIFNACVHGFDTGAILDETSGMDSFEATNLEDAFFREVKTSCIAVMRASGIACARFAYPSMRCCRSDVLSRRP